MVASKRIQYKPTAIAAISAAWSFAEALKIKEVGPNKFSFLFLDPAHKAPVLQQAPWNICGFLLILRDWPLFEVINDMDFNKSAYWIQIHRFPLEHLSSTDAHMIRSKLGKVIEVDPGVDSVFDAS